MGDVVEKLEQDIKLPLGAPLQIFPCGNLLKSFPQGDTSAAQLGFGLNFASLR